MGGIRKAGAVHNSPRAGMSKTQEDAVIKSIKELRTAAAANGVPTLITSNASSRICINVPQHLRKHLT